MNIEIIGSIDGKHHYNEALILSLLKLEQTELSYGNDFMGKPGTGLHVSETEVIKIRNDLNLNATRAIEYIKHALAKEQRLKVHHPCKTWFLLKRENGEIKIGNICPRLTPIHTLVNKEESQENDQNIFFLREIYRYYFYTTLYNFRLDEGLSNFGINEKSQIFYLDDDVYSWDHFVSFSHFLGVLIRGNNWLDERHAELLGTELFQLISIFFEDTHTNTMVANKLRDIFIPDENRKHILNIVIDKLRTGKVIHKRVRYKQNYLAIFADVHSNLPALDAVLNFLKQENIDQGIVLGDTVGYGPHPKACIERLEETNFTVIKGNHDHAAATGETKRGMSSTAKWCIEWTIPELSPEHIQWLADLPLEINSPEEAEKQWMAVHGSPMDPNYFYAYVYEMTYTQNLDVMAKRALDLCFHGHTHVPGVYFRNKGNIDRFSDQPEQALNINSHSLICPGSVGQPRNNQIGAQIAIYDQKTHNIRFVSIDYSAEQTIKDMQKHNFPASLIDRLRGGY